MERRNVDIGPCSTGSTSWSVCKGSFSGKDTISRWSSALSFLSSGSTFASLICVWFLRTGPIEVLTMQDLGAVLLIAFPYIQGWCLFAGLGLTNTFSPYENSFRGCETLLLYWGIDLRLLYSMFSYTRLGDATWGVSWWSAVGMMSLSLLDLRRWAGK